MDGLAAFSDAALGSGELETKLEDAYRADPDFLTAREDMVAIHSDRSRLGGFVERYLRGRKRCVLDQAKLPDGSVTWDPAKIITNLSFAML